VHTRGAGDTCSKIRDDGVQAVETINMIVDQVSLWQTLTTWRNLRCTVLVFSILVWSYSAVTAKITKTLWQAVEHVRSSVRSRLFKIK